MKNLGLIAILFLLAACSQNSSQNEVQPDSQPGIIGGRDVIRRDSSFKSTAGIIMVDDKSGKILGICTGTLVSKDVVLTAAHCIRASEDKVNFIVYFGETLLDLRQLNVYRSGIATVVHEDYESSEKKEVYDVGLIKFSGEAPAGYTPAALLKDEKYLKDGTELLVAGYGRNLRYGRGNAGAGQLRYVKLNITDIKFSDMEFVSASLSKGICAGDSGGPAYVTINEKQYVAGISHRVLSVGGFACIYSSLFTRVDQFHTWIEKNINQL